MGGITHSAGHFDTASVLPVRPFPGEPLAMAQPAPKIESGAMDLPGLAAEPSEGMGLGHTAGLLDDCELRVRAAVARDLHDRVAQPLAALLLVLEELKQDPGDRRLVIRRIDTVQDQVRTALFGLREVLCELREQEWLD